MHSKYPPLFSSFEISGCEKSKEIDHLSGETSGTPIASKKVSRMFDFWPGFELFKFIYLQKLLVPAKKFKEDEIDENFSEKYFPKNNPQ